MNDSEFKNLIQSADKLAPSPTAPADLARVVRQKARRRTNALRIAVAACVIIAAGAIVTFYIASRPRALSLQDRVAQLQVQVETLQRQIEQLKSLQEEQIKERNLYAAAIDPIEKFNRQVDDAAFAYLYQGNRLYEEMNLTDAAVDMYEQVIKISPESKWARTAHQKISQISKQKTNKGDLL